MKKVFTIIALAAVALSTAACGNAGRPKGDMDSLSYAVGVKYGIGMSQMKDFKLDNERIKAAISDFIANGDVNNEEFQQGSQELMMFMYTKAGQYMRTKQLRDNTITDCPDTLPALPELYDETITPERVADLIGQDMGARIKMSEPRFESNEWMFAGFDDAAALETPEHADSLLLVDMAQLEAVYMAGMKAEQERRAAEHAKIAEENATASAEWLAEIEKMEGVQKTESGILYRIDREGTGAQATADEDVVLVNYEGKTRDGNIFDSSYERNEPISFPLNRVIKGWTEGMKLVKEGGQIILWIPSELAYGERGSGDAIGPNEALEFKVELLELNPEE